ncbi:branched-chain amino acid transport system permease protein [Neorhizobium galegae]|uniref:branched-chain amino acid ABC transporter permease n=1 Tax=Neorhizobium galegae TaxID=399 RepID=UPI00278A9C1E|nr:branched-chain amino acid ABC transporter permease [Neorhizobium galegae]MDQ0137632.1 branched-chain amino acid transport system permease protein [Neorhizobium galegae]
MIEYLGLLLDAVVSGILIGGFYAAMAIGISIAFGMLGISNIAHPAFILLGSFLAYVLNSRFNLDPILVGLIFLVPFYFLGTALYSGYEAVFERRGSELIRGLAFFFGLLFITEVGLQIAFGVDYRLVEAPYIGPSYNIGPVSLPMRMCVPFVTSILLLLAAHVFFSRTFTGRAIMAVAQDRFALQLMGAAPVRIKRIAFGLSTATAALAGALLIILQPVEPSMARDFIGRVFAICVLGGMGSLSGTLIAAIVVAIAESITANIYGPSWSPAVAFGLLLITLVVKPSGLMGRT